MMEREHAPEKCPPHKAPAKIVLNEVQAKWFRKFYPNSSNQWMADELGVARSSIRYIARRLGVEKVPDYNPRFEGWRRSPESREKLRVKRLKLIRRERLNLRMGLHREGKLHLVEHPYTSQQTTARKRGKQMGYVTFSQCDDDDPRRYTLYYADELLRHHRYERFARTIGLHFAPLSSFKGYKATGGDNYAARPTERKLSEWML